MAHDRDTLFGRAGHARWTEAGYLRPRVSCVGTIACKSFRGHLRLRVEQGIGEG